MRNVTCDIAIIGAGTAGLHAYKSATAAGARAVIIEKGKGGSTCTRVGCMPSKALIAAGRAAAQARRAHGFGVRAGEVTIDGPAVMRRVRAERDRLTQGILDEFHAIPDDRRLHGEARFTRGGALEVADVARVQARSVVIATGSTPRVPDAFAAIAALVRTNEDIFELEELPAAMGVVGAGPLGLELAQAFARLGVDVTVLDKGEAVGALVDPACEAAAREALSRDVALHMGVDVEAALQDGRARLRWSGAADGEATVDLVLVASGRDPALGGLNLQAAGLPLDDDGAPRFDKASHRIGGTDVFIAGDCGDWRPVLHEASRGGRTAGAGAAGVEAARVLPALAVAFTEPNLVQVGVRFDALPPGARIGEAKPADNGRAQIDDEEAGLVRLYADASGKLLGATLVAHAGEHLGQLVAMAIDGGLDADRFSDQAWYHPTMEEVLQAAARDV
ncbi:MAG: dihydrolipoyl dehydrogenase [Caulobacteraceae bacterium]|nr:dihydrolipoyl dehydrogenase [Caulobacter sp.]